MAVGLRPALPGARVAAQRPVVRHRRRAARRPLRSGAAGDPLVNPSGGRPPAGRAGGLALDTDSAQPADGWPSAIAQTDPYAIVLPSGHPLVGLLEQDPAWQLFSHDRVATVFTRVGFAP